MQNLSKISLIFIILFASCGPKAIIPEKDMVLIIAKIQLIDASVQNHVFQKTLLNKDTIDYYSSTIQSYGYTKAQFDSSLSYYSKNPKILDVIYDKVITELSKLETKISTENKINEDLVVKDTTTNLWNLCPIYELPDSGAQVAIDFIIPVKGLGVYTIAADVFIHANDETVNPSMEAYFYFDDKSKEGRKSGLTSKIYEKVNDTLTYSMQLELRNTLVTHLKGSLFAHKNLDKKFTEHASIKNIKVYYKPGRLKKTKTDRKIKRIRQIEEKE